MTFSVSSVGIENSNSLSKNQRNLVGKKQQKPQAEQALDHYFQKEYM